MLRGLSIGGIGSGFIAVVVFVAEDVLHVELVDVFDEGDAAADVDGDDAGLAHEVVEADVDDVVGIKLQVADAAHAAHGEVNGEGFADVLVGVAECLAFEVDLGAEVEAVVAPAVLLLAVAFLETSDEQADGFAERVVALGLLWRHAGLRFYLLSIAE